MDTGYKVWHCSYRETGRYGYYRDIECIVIAEIKEKALGMAVRGYPKTAVSGWTATEIPSDREGVHWISERES